MKGFFMKKLSTVFGLIAAAALPAAVQVAESPDAVTIANDHLSAVITSTGGKLASLKVLKKNIEYAHGFSEAKLKSNALAPGDGFAKSRIFDTPSDITLYNAKYKLRVVRKSAESVVVEAVTRAVSGHIKGLEIIHRYTLNDGEQRLLFEQLFRSDNTNVTFSPWLHNAPQLPDSVAEKNTVRIFARSKQGIYSTPAIKSPQVHNMLVDAAEGWLGFAGTNNEGICMVSDVRKIGHFYCWLGSEYFCSTEFIFAPVKMADGGNVSNQLCFIPVSGLDNFKLAGNEYVAGLAGNELKLFAAAPAKTLKITCTLNGKTVSRSFSNVKAASCVTLPLPAWKDTVNGNVKIEFNGKTYNHDARFNADRNYNEVKTSNDYKQKNIRTGLNMTHATEVLYLANNISNPVHFGLQANYKGKKAPKSQLYLEVPDCIKVSNPSPAADKTAEITRNGKSYTQYVFNMNRGSYYGVVSMFMTTALPAGEKSAVYYYAKSPLGNQKPQTLPVVSVDFRPVKRIPKRLVAGIGFYSAEVCRRWPDIFSNLNKCGMNVISLSGYDVNPEKFRDLVLDAKAKNFYVTGNTSPTHKVQGLQYEPDGWVMNLEGKREMMLCPTYRGKAYAAEVDKVTKHAEAGVAIAFWDTENWTRREYCFCPRCISKFEVFFKNKYPQEQYLSPLKFELDPGKYPKLHSAWSDFRLAIGAEFFNSITQEYRRKLTASGIKGMAPEGDTLITGLYNVTPKKIYHHFMRYEELAAAGAVNITMPSYYYSGDAFRTGQAVKGVREFVKNSRIIPWITGGAGPEYESIAINHKFVLLEIFFNGCMGFTTWPWMGWDALDLKYVAEVMNMAVPLENIIVDGKVDNSLKSDQEHVRIAALCLKDEMTILLSDYYHDHLVASKLTLQVNKDCKLFDVESGEVIAKLKKGVNTVAIPSHKENARLFYAGDQAPRTDFNIPLQKFVKNSKNTNTAFPGVAGDKMLASEQAKPQRIIFENAFYRVGIEKKTGHFSLLEWKNSGKKYDFYWMNLDALAFSVDGVLGRINKAPAKKLEVVTNTPEKMVLEVVSDGGLPASGITAKIRYTFTAGSPLIRCRILFDNPQLKQSKGMRLNQFAFEKANWKYALLSEPLSEKDLANTTGTHTLRSSKAKYSWSGFSDGQNAFAIIAIGTQRKSFVHVYNQTKQYCNGYMSSTADRKIELDQYIYVGNGGNAEVKKWAEYAAALD